jgi:hypothetical protein
MTVLPTTSPTRLTGHYLIHRLIQLDLDPSDYVVFGSGPLLAHGLLWRRIGDLDVVARGRAWTRAQELGVRLTRQADGAPMVQFWGGLIEVSPEWRMPHWDADTLIDEAEFIDGIPFARLDRVLAYKQLLDRSKDRFDIREMKRSLRRLNSTDQRW